MSVVRYIMSDIFNQSWCKSIRSRVAVIDLGGKKTAVASSVMKHFSDDSCQEQLFPALGNFISRYFVYNT